MDSEAPIGATPLLLITGFLGSGKTTLINRMLALTGQAQPRLGVVVNEFGQIGIDGTLLAQPAGSAMGSGILELANGCVCCVRGTEMWDAALELVDRAGAEVLLVETSGLVEPRVLLEQHRLLPTATANRIDLRGLLAVVDVLHVREAVALRSEAAQQLKLADRLLLTKLDLAVPAQVQNTHRLLDELDASTERTSLACGAPDAEVANVLRWSLRGPRSSRSALRAASAHGHRHGGRQLVAVSLHEPEPLLAEPLSQLLRELAGEVLRVKGIVRVLGAPWQGLQRGAAEAPALAALHLAGRQVELQPLSAASAAAAATHPGSTLVFIGEELDESWLRLRLSGCRSRLTTSPIPTAHGALPV